MNVRCLEVDTVEVVVSEQTPAFLAADALLIFAAFSSIWSVLCSDANLKTMA